MTAQAATIPDATAAPFDRRLAILLAMAMFVLVVDTSLMNVSISAVIGDIGATASGVQAAIALEALVSAAFILISSKVGDLIGRKRAYTLGLLGYAVGALAMVLTQSLAPMIVFWAICGGLGASLLLPAMQSLIHGNFEGADQKRVYALTGAAAAIAAAIGPLLGGFVTTFLSWRVGFLLELVIIMVVLSGLGRVKDVPYTGDRKIDLVGAVLSVVGMGGVVLGILAWQEGAEAVGALIAVGVVAPRVAGLVAPPPQAAGPGLADRSGPVQVPPLPARDQRPDAPAGQPGRPDDRPAAVPADGPRVQRPRGGPVDRAAVAHDVRGGDPRRSEAGGPSVGEPHPGRVPAAHHRRADHAADRAPQHQRPVVHDPAHHRRHRARAPRLAAQQLHAGADLRRADQRGGRA